jgi:hypothetical protein
VLKVEKMVLTAMILLWVKEAAEIVGIASAVMVMH